jgi:hypothetical protein
MKAKPKGPKYLWTVQTNPRTEQLVAKVLAREAKRSRLKSRTDGEVNR